MPMELIRLRSASTDCPASSAPTAAVTAAAAAPRTTRGVTAADLGASQVPFLQRSSKTLHVKSAYATTTTQGLPIDTRKARSRWINLISLSFSIAHKQPVSAQGLRPFSRFLIAASALLVLDLFLRPLTNDEFRPGVDANTP
ncbi:hypothetical protein B0H14DRAFT_3447638 [Mycena olivaceomarginata]|nr:hypothetical protein B0H14DRAFT_3447638 [Mycena olivaceomarginata]